MLLEQLDIYVEINMFCTNNWDTSYIPKCKTPYHKCKTWNQWGGLQVDVTQTIKLLEENTFSVSLGGHKITKEKLDKVDFMKIKTSAHQKMPVRKWTNHNLQKIKKSQHIIQKLYSIQFST